MPLRQTRRRREPGVGTQLRERAPEDVPGAGGTQRLRPRRIPATGRVARVAEDYRLAAEFARTHEGFDDDGINDFLERAERLDPSRDRTAP